MQKVSGLEFRDRLFFSICLTFSASFIRPEFPPQLVINPVHDRFNPNRPSGQHISHQGLDSILIGRDFSAIGPFFELIRQAITGFPCGRKARVSDAQRFGQMLPGEGYASLQGVRIET